MNINLIAEMITEDPDILSENLPSQRFSKPGNDQRHDYSYDSVIAGNQAMERIGASRPTVNMSLMPGVGKRFKYTQISPRYSEPRSPARWLPENTPPGDTPFEVVKIAKVHGDVYYKFDDEDKSRFMTNKSWKWLVMKGHIELAH